MSLLEDVTKGSLSTILVGVAAAIVAPTVLPALASGFRPLAKAAVKGGLMIYDAVKETVAEAGEQLNDLVAEARSEMAESATEAEAAATSRKRKSE
ncbi:MAG: DUF5132 domain-containing protein [Nitrospirota bacterium]